MIRHGLSLMEVILATSLLMAATATVGRLAYVTTQNAQRAEDRAIAAQIAEYQIQRLLLGQQPVQTKSRGPVLEPNANLLSADSPTTPQDQIHPWDEWQVALQVNATSIPRLFQVQIDVFRLRTDLASDTAASTLAAESEPATDDVLFTYSVVRLIRVNS